ncbi:TetR family transcriptional regulator [Rhizobium sp. 32-5/1]|uniref:TetR/AcrR family transcriptional regulator n=1 Tax=Rhizobium sp. 32-5/1 TaxID=3019602 RepID=UPI00240DB5CE|nr:TetR family transcriptional regulator [Rhizobium sp. 32-5/1]WEZ83428.1 TetR family transcriptional regulator [Rhizobium sp. 32-5/1]
MIDRDRLLDVAEKCVGENGAISLTFGSLAAAAGLSKGTVQTIFVTRDNLLEALLTRWMDREKVRFEDEKAGVDTAEAHVLAHLKTTEQEDVEIGRTVLTMLAAIAENGRTSHVMKDWYQDRLRDLEADTPDARRQRIAYLAAEGAFLVRNVIGLKIEKDRWEEIFRDLRDLARSWPVID